MHLEAGDLCEFYARPLGAVVRRLLSHRIRARWRRVDGLTVMGLGFPTPYLGMFRGEARRLGALMPVGQGALIWPADAPGHAVMVEEDQLPLPDNSVDRILIVHGLEFAERVRPFLREIWRVMAPEGQLLMVVPNRGGVWARTERSPFGYGRPYSRGQLEKLLNDALFAPLDWTWALHVPPIESRIVLRSSIACERMGQRFFPSIGGVTIVEAKKQLMAPVGRVRVARTVGGLVTIRKT